MPELDPQKLITKLDSIPEQDREGYLQGLKAQGYTWKSTSSADSSPEKPGVIGATKEAFQIMSGEPAIDSRDQQVAAMLMRRSLPGIIGQAGAYLSGKAQQAAGGLAETTGKYGERLIQSGYPSAGKALKAAGIGIGGALGTGAEATLPKGPLSTIAMATGLEGQKIPFSEEPAPPAYKTPTRMQRTLADLASVQSGGKSSHIAAVMANPEIMSDATPSTAEVGNKYQELFKRLGESVDQKTYQEVTGMRYRPSETQVSKLQGIVSDTMSKLDAGQDVSAAEAFLARSAAKTAMRNQGVADVAGLSRDASALDKYLAEYKGIPELRDLGHEYFRASAKEDLSSIIPKNKRGDPAVIRGLLMANYGKEAVLSLMQGEFGKAITQGTAAGMMSPAVQGTVIPFITGETSPAIRAAGVATLPQTSAALEALKRQRTEYGQ